MTLATDNIKRVLVTGGAGFIGSHCVEQLLEDGCEVRVLDNLSTGKLTNLPQIHPRLRILQGDIRDAGMVATAVAGVDAVLHLAAQVSVFVSIDEPAASAQHNIDGFINVMEAARAAGVRRMVFASSAAVYGTPESLPLDEDARLGPLSPYGLEKQINEQYSALYQGLHGFSSMGLRFFNVYGPRQDPSSQYAGVISKFVDRLLDDQAPMIFGDGQQTRDFVYVKDVARACVAALRADVGGALNVATGAQTSLLDLADTLNQVIGTDFAPIFQPARHGDIKHSLANPARMAAVLDVQASWSLADGLAALVESVRPQQAAAG